MAKSHEKWPLTLLSFWFSLHSLLSGDHHWCNWIGFVHLISIKSAKFLVNTWGENIVRSWQLFTLLRCWRSEMQLGRICKQDFHSIYLAPVHTNAMRQAYCISLTYFFISSHLPGSSAHQCKASSISDILQISAFYCLTLEKAHWTIFA